MASKGSGASNTRNKNMAMAARMKAEGVTRTTGRCPICNNMIGLNSLPFHITTCKGGSKRK